MRMIRRVAEAEMPLVGEAPLSEWTAAVQAHKSLRQLVNRDIVMMSGLRRYMALSTAGNSGAPSAGPAATLAGTSNDKMVLDEDAVQGKTAWAGKGNIGGGGGGTSTRPAMEVAAPASLADETRSGDANLELSM